MISSQESRGSIDWALTDLVALIHGKLRALPLMQSRVLREEIEVSPDRILVMAILAVAVALFISERLRVDLVAMLVLIALSLTGLVTTEEAFSGFASPAVIASSTT